MASILAIVSKPVFEKAAGKAPTLGARLAMDRYVSANKALAPLAEAGRLVLVTVRPPNDTLWLVGVLEAPVFDGTQWTSAPSTVPITDITALRAQLRFESGAGITAAPGALAMSLQTPRKLAPGDLALLDAAIAGAGEPGALPKAPAGAIASSGGRSDAILGAVLDDPDSDAARHVYADALAARNDPRGELVQIGLALAGKLSIRKRDLLATRHAELLREHRAEWFPYKLDYKVSRGFIWSVRGSLDKLAADAAVFDKEPVVEVEVSGKVDKLVTAPWLPRVRRLIVRGELGDDGFAKLVASKAVANLRELNVTNSGLSGEGLGALGSHLPRCVSLVLTANELGQLDGLAAWKHAGNLERLYLTACALEDLGALLTRPWPKLHRLCLTDNELDDSAVEAIRTSGKFPALRRLELGAHDG